MLIGDQSEANVKVPGWQRPMLSIISDGKMLNLGKGMRLHMCHDDGEDRVFGSYEELLDAGVKMPIEISCSKLNIRLDDEVAVYVMYIREGSY